MLYPFKCECGETRDEVMRASEYNDNQLCHICGRKMARVYSVPFVSVPQRDGFNHGLGCPERLVKDKVRQLRDQGRDIVEVGNESANVKPKESNYDLTGADVAELNRIMG